MLFLKISNIFVFEIMFKRRLKKSCIRVNEFNFQKKSFAN